MNNSVLKEFIYIVTESYALPGTPQQVPGARPQWTEKHMKLPLFQN